MFWRAYPHGSASIAALAGGEIGANRQRLSQNLSGDRFFSLSSAKWRWRRGLGRGGAFLLGIPLSSILSPLVPHGARRKQN